MYQENRHIFMKDDILYCLGEFNEDVSNKVIPELESLIDKLIGQKDSTFTIIINSPGGYFIELNSILYYLDLMKKNGITIITKVIGEASSCASVLACYGDVRFMHKYAIQLMHFGNMPMGEVQTPLQADRIKRYTDNHFERIIDIYSKHTKLNKKQLRTILSDDNCYLSAKQCLEYGLIDYIV